MPKMSTRGSAMSSGIASALRGAGDVVRAIDVEDGLRELGIDLGEGDR